MRLLLLRWALIIPISLLVLSSEVRAEKRITLNSGNGTYSKTGSLTNPRNDARLTVRTLNEVGLPLRARASI